MDDIAKKMVADLEKCADKAIGQALYNHLNNYTCNEESGSIYINGLEVYLIMGVEGLSKSYVVFLEVCAVRSIEIMVEVQYKEFNTAAEAETEFNEHANRIEDSNANAQAAFNESKAYGSGH